jgi:hypothetical protein
MYLPDDQKIYQMAIKYSKATYNIPYGHKMLQKSIKIYMPTFSTERPSKIYPM